jgi:DNA-binding Xre family transcriptional regulator
MHNKHKSKLARREISRATLEALYLSERTILEICAELEVQPRKLYELLDVAGIPRRRGIYQRQDIILTE